MDNNNDINKIRFKLELCKEVLEFYSDSTEYYIIELKGSISGEYTREGKCVEDRGYKAKKMLRVLNDGF